MLVRLCRAPFVFRAGDPKGRGTLRSVGHSWDTTRSATKNSSLIARSGGPRSIAWGGGNTFNGQTRNTFNGQWSSSARVRRPLRV